MPDPKPRPITTVAGMIGAGLVRPAEAAALEQVAAGFRIRVTPAKQRAADAAGVAAQFVPDARE